MTLNEGPLNWGIFVSTDINITITNNILINKIFLKIITEWVFALYISMHPLRLNTMGFNFWL